MTVFTSYIVALSTLIVIAMCNSSQCPADGDTCGPADRDCTFSQGACHHKRCEAPLDSDIAKCAATDQMIVPNESVFGDAIEVDTALQIVTGVTLIRCDERTAKMIHRQWSFQIKHSGCSPSELTELKRDARIELINGTVTATAGRFASIKNSIDKSCDTWNRVDPNQDCLDRITCDSSGASRRGSSSIASLCIVGAGLGATTLSAFGNHRALGPIAAAIAVAQLVSSASAQETTTLNNNNSNSTVVSTTCSAWLEARWQSVQADRLHVERNETTNRSQIRVSVVVSGRPFVTSDGGMAIANIERATQAPASTLPLAGNSPAGSTSRLTSALVDAAALESTSASAEQWLQQAVAEHASIASFAQFTLNLMANAAPSPLLMSALRAAQDEVLHADASLAMTRAISRDSNLSFAAFPSAAIDGVRAQSLIDLARSTMREGAIAELLSTLLVVERAVDARRHSLDSVAAVWREIATDEARHALLAWRTVAWCISTTRADSEMRAQMMQMLADEVDIATKAIASHDGVHKRAVDNLIVPLMARVRNGTFVDGAQEAEERLTAQLAASDVFDVETVCRAILLSC